MADISINVYCDECDTTEAPLFLGAGGSGFLDHECGEGGTMRVAVDSGELGGVVEFKGKPRRARIRTQRRELLGELLAAKALRALAMERGPELAALSVELDDVAIKIEEDAAAELAELEGNSL